MPAFAGRTNVQQVRLALWAVGLRGSIVITEQATHSLAALHAPVLRLNLHAVNQFVAKPLTVALAMVMDQEVGERTPEVLLTQRNQPIQACLFDRPNKALRHPLMASSSPNTEGQEQREAGFMNLPPS
jgi:hypothetical protein